MPSRSVRRRRGAVLVAVVVLVAGCGGSGPPGGGRVSGPDLSRLPQLTTFATVSGLPRDTGRAEATDGTVVRPTAPLAVSAEPDGTPVAVLPDRQLDGPTWVPVVETREDWLRVMLPSKPNGSTGWIRREDDVLMSAHSPYLVRVETRERRLSLFDSGHRIGKWTVAVGDEDTPTPLGRTFLLALLKPAKPTFSPLIVPVGAHSETLDTFGGGPGTVAFHGWKDPSVFGKAVTHGCVRVPPDALERLSKIPLGTTVLVT